MAEGKPMRELHLPLFNICGRELAAAGYRKPDVVRAYAELHDVFGSDWIEQQISRSAGGLLDSHPLLAGMNTGGTPQVVRALELAVILRHFARDPELPGLVGALRDWDHFESIYYSLRVALRFKLLGFHVRLEPSTRDGKADVLACRPRLKIGLECTSVRSRIKGRTSVDSLNAILHGLELPQDSVLELRFKRRLTRDVERTTRRVVRSLAEGYGGRGRRASSKAVAAALRPADDREKRLLRVRGDIGTTRQSFAVMDAVRGTGWDCLVVHGRGSAADPADPRTYELSTYRREALIRVRFHRLGRGEGPSPEDEIDKRISAKVAQIGAHPGEWVSALFLNVPFDLDSLDVQRIWSRLAGDQLMRCPKLSAVFITQNRWTHLQRNQLCATCLPNAAGTKLLPLSVVESLNRLELELDIARLLAQP